MEDGFKQFKQNASSFFNRTLQKTEEALKTTESTPLDPQLEDLIRQCEMRNTWAQSLVTITEAVIQPNPASRLEDVVLKGFDRKKERSTVEEKFGNSLTKIGKELGQTSPNAVAMIKAGEAEIAVGKSVHAMQDGIEGSYLQWLRSFVTSSARTALQERENLENIRLDLDRAKTQLKRAKDDASKKMVCEQQVTENQTLFDRQCDATKRALEKCIADFDGHKDALTRLLNAQKEYYQGCLNAITQALQ